MCRAMEITYKEGRNDGAMNTRIDILHTLTQQYGFSTEKAMDVLKLSEDERTLYTDLLNQQ